jgi:hypothetical protein
MCFFLLILINNYCCTTDTKLNGYSTKSIIIMAMEIGSQTLLMQKNLFLFRNLLSVAWIVKEFQTSASAA